jgi:hypothetical protein
MKTVLSNLHDCETMSAINQNPHLSSPLLEFSDVIRWKEASGDYEAALRDYERALQIKDVVEVGDLDLEGGAIESLLQLGQYENVLSRVVAQDSKKNQCTAKLFAMEAAWRLGRWDTLSNLVKEAEANTFDTTWLESYRGSIGKGILSLHDKDFGGVAECFQIARLSVMSSLSSAARESYSKSYADIVRLHCIRELEDFSMFLCGEDRSDISLSLNELAESTTHEGWAWRIRLDLATPLASSAIMNTRVAIARLASDSVMETSLLFQMGRKARKSGMFTVAENNLSKAEAILASIPKEEYCNIPVLDGLLNDIRAQYAKLKKQSGENATALKILGQDFVEDAFKEMLCDGVENAEKIKKIAVKHERRRIQEILGMTASVTRDDAILSDRFARRLLRLTEWTVDGGMQDGGIIDRFQAVITLSPRWEKGKKGCRKLHFLFNVINNRSLSHAVIFVSSIRPAFFCSQDIFGLRSI